MDAASSLTLVSGYVLSPTSSQSLSVPIPSETTFRNTGLLLTSYPYSKQATKQPHKYTSNPPTTDLTDENSLRGYRTSALLDPANSAGVPQPQAVDEAAIVAARVVRTQNVLRGLGFGNVNGEAEADVSFTGATTVSITLVLGTQVPRRAGQHG